MRASSSRLSRWVSRRAKSTAAAYDSHDFVDLAAKQTNHVWHPMTNQRAWHEGSAAPPPPVVKARGCTLTRADGEEMIDGIGGLWCVNVGYGREELAETAKAAMMDLGYLAPTMGSVPQIELAAKMAELLDLQGGTHTFFTASGSEANESAFKIARMYHWANSKDPHGGLRHKIIARYRAYHGNTSGAMAATGQAERKTGFGVSAPGFVHVPPPYSYRRHEKFDEDDHCDEVLRQLEETIVFEGAETVAAFIAEPVISGGGVLVPHDAYLKKVRALCDKYGILLILDEVVSGYGRTGAMFGHRHYGIKPDIITMAKGLTSGYVPLGACSVNREIFQSFMSSPNLPPRLAHFRQINTYGGHPVACAVGLKNVEILERDHLVEAAATQGRYFMDQLHRHLGAHKFVGEVRGKGLLIGVELVKDKSTKEPLDDATMGQILAKAMAKGVIVGRNGSTIPGLANVLIFAPPLVITQEECNKCVSVLKDVLAEF